MSQLRLFEVSAPEWKLDEETRRTGSAWVKMVRATVQEILDRQEAEREAQVLR